MKFFSRFSFLSRFGSHSHSFYPLSRPMVSHSQLVFKQQVLHTKMYNYIEIRGKNDATNICIPSHRRRRICRAFFASHRDVFFFLMAISLLFFFWSQKTRCWILARKESIDDKYSMEDMRNCREKTRDSTVDNITIWNLENWCSYVRWQII